MSFLKDLQRILAAVCEWLWEEHHPNPTAQVISTATTKKWLVIDGDRRILHQCHSKTEAQSWAISHGYRLTQKTNDY